MADWIRKPGMTAHPIDAILRDAAGPFDLPSGTTVVCRAKLPGAAVVKFSAGGSVIAPGAIVGVADRGRVRYSFASTDLDTPGIYEVDWVVTIPGSGVQVFPENGYQILLVMEGADLT